MDAHCAGGHGGVHYPIVDGKVVFAQVMRHGGHEFGKLRWRVFFDFDNGIVQFVHCVYAGGCA